VRTGIFHGAPHKNGNPHRKSTREDALALHANPRYSLENMKLPGLAVLSLVACIAGAHAQKSGLLREPDAYYLEDFMEKSVRFPVREQIPIYYDAAGTRSLGVLVPRQEVQLLAVSPQAVRVRGRAMQGQVAGWIARSAAAIDPEFLDNLKKTADRHALVQELIKKREVATGMTQEEVIQSVGKPQKKSTRIDPGSKIEIWEYIRYENVPHITTGYDRFGNLINTTTYIKTPTGRMSIELKDGIVASIEATEGERPPGPVRLVVPPIDLW
jgi:ribosomal 50S subunit-recycling heat shock protein